MTKQPTPEVKRQINEVCKCGHSRIAHLDTVAFGHGACIHNGGNKECYCNKFTYITTANIIE